MSTFEALWVRILQLSALAGAAGFGLWLEWCYRSGMSPKETP